ncbi:MAG TPA: UDP-N-acetylmuramoyl-L-alanyl-D-glutamate--2,6-diaminopimelate ligase, partial [Candidatus Dormibacteraeota bacterium]|nr:UDP-N-acetylmuramoyl-L-alanyl-D-glutamate--2,6-diaminopimelate ligase [Candidatus Dormibacteraeota bacterium]
MARLAALLAAAGIPAPPYVDPEVRGLAYDSRRVEPGSLFVAVPGFHVDGHDFVEDAVSRGAAAVVGSREMRVPVPYVRVADTRVALSALACAFLGNPSRDLYVAGITGTDGKTTTATLLHAAWRGAGIAAGALTTVDWRAHDEVRANKTRQTTLEALELQEHLGELHHAGCTHVALETSSHALELHRADHVTYHAAVYTKVTSEHLDVHGSRDAYLRAKARLLGFVSSRDDGLAVLDATDDFALPLLLQIPVAERLTYSIDPRIGADLTAEDIDSAAAGVRFTAHTPWGSEGVQLQLPGRFNAANALAAMATACASGVSLRDAITGMANLDRVTGRMERVDLGQPFAVVVDYAHTAESLEKVLRELRSATAGRLWVVFGSAGERDLEKRPAMGAVAAQHADVAVVTDEDPREEDRVRILEQIAGGAVAAGGRRDETVVVIPDRTEAIAYAIAHATAGDTVLCAGKGHESTLIIGRESLPWDERAAVEDAI